MIIVYHYPKCTTCKKALAWLQDHDIDFDARHIVEQTPTAKEFESFFERSGLPIRRFFNTSGMVYREGNYKARVASMTASEAAAELAANGMLVKRPLVIAPQGILVGFHEKRWEDMFVGDTHAQ